LDRLREAWTAAGRTGTPRLVGLSYFALGDDARSRARDYLAHYYGGWGAGMADAIPVTAHDIVETAGAFRRHGYDELILVPTIAELDQLDGAADAVRDEAGGGGAP
jgi:hypothetical protein